ncbi:MAG: UDP-N-acetylglucosamine--N-acetylmuramyl-(pentapeptide) pyrophosphoryl-undecaprenol N-acetylglucosamine transferase [Planctomycetota bacterium]|jgi:UDP-N-acetylglucosamine--N-acetylmuramyl-(pentapeptide) pyrophosphoryl-undecaprenol N-acetylglucosamine transferase
MRILFAGGGTGGHILPARNLADWLRADAEDHEVLFLIAGRDLEKSFFEQTSWRRKPLFPGFQSRPSLLNYSAWRKAAKLARDQIRAFKPDAMILTGGYVSFPALLGRGWPRFPVYVLEQNALAGRTVRLCALVAKRVFCHFELTASRWKKAMVTGSPLPTSYRGSGAVLPAKARRFFRLKEGLVTLLVAGGSQGAKAVNDLMLEYLPLLSQEGDGKIQVIHVTGHRDFERVRDGYKGTGIPNAVRSFVDPMEMAYRAADLILCRGGGMTIAEITGMGLPAVIVPYPHHRNRHQYKNAVEIVESGGAFVVEEREFNARAFGYCIIETLLSPARLEEMAKKSRGLGRLNGSRRILEVIRSDLHGRVEEPEEPEEQPYTYFKRGR